MQQNKIVQFLLFLVCCNLLFASTTVQFGMKMSNNQTIDYWLLTPSAEIEFGSRRLCLSLDGWVGTYTPALDANGYTVMSHFSAIPMVRIPYKRFVASAGYGLSNIYRREEIHNAGGNLLITSGQIQHGALKAHLGYLIPYQSNLSIVLKTGYSYVDKNLSSFSAGLGIEFSGTSNQSAPVDRRKIVAYQTTISEQAPEKNPEPVRPIKAKLSRFCIIENSDKVVNELNSTIEVVLIQSGMQVIAWNKILEAYNQNASKADKIVSASGEVPRPPTGMQIALETCKMMELTTAIETSLRYTFKAYGGDVLVQSAYVRMIDLSTGNVLWATDFNMQDASYRKCKQKLAEQTLEAIQRLK